MPLTSKQQDAVDCTKNQIVIAIAGSGKTFTLIEQVTKILRDGGTPVISTFTKKAAAEISERLASSVNNPLQVSTVGTLHSLALRQLKLSSSPPNLLTPSDQSQFHKRAFYHHCSSFKKLDIQSMVSYIENKEIGKDQQKVPQYEKAFKFYRDLLSQHRMISMNDLIPAATKSMLASSVNYFDATHLLIDEFQDTDPVQLKWIDAFMASSTNPTITVYGDDDQSIYSFRNSVGYDAFMHIRKNYDPTITFLDTNFRSHPEIVSAGKQLIKNNQDRISKDFNAHKQPGGSLQVKRFTSRDVELSEIASLSKLLPKPLAVITRTNLQLRLISDVLNKHEIPYTITTKDSIFDQEESIIYLGLLSYLYDKTPSAITNALQISGMSESSIKSSLKFTSNSGLKLSKGSLHPEDTKLCMSLINTLAKSRANMSDPSKAAQPIFDWLVSNSGENPVLNKVHHIFTNRLKGDLRSRLMFLTSTKEQDEESIVLMTGHASKGRQFESVIVPFAHSKVFPYEKPDEPTNLQEERRLFYVIVTRAIKNLVITHHDYPELVCENRKPRILSPFVIEMQS